MSECKFGTTLRFFRSHFAFTFCNNGFFGFSSFNTEQKIDGNALKLLAREGNTTQYAACGLTTVGDQMHLKEMISGLTLPLVPVLSRHRKKPQEIGNAPTEFKF